MVFGGARLAFAGTPADEVRVAALAPDRELNDRAYAERGEHMAPVLDELFTRSEAEARAGARIIAWSEAAALVPEEDQPGVVERAAELADTENVYLQISMIVLLTDPDRGGDVNENHAVLLGPDGDVLWDYLKSKPTPGDGHSAGPGDHPGRRHAVRTAGDGDLPGRLLPVAAAPGRPEGRGHPAAALERLGGDHRLARPAGAVPRRRERHGAGAPHPARASRWPRTRSDGRSARSRTTSPATTTRS